MAIETTTDCNRHCSYCPLGNPVKKESRGVQYMAPRLYTTILEQLADLGFGGRLALQGYGEPMRDPHIIERIELAHEMLPKAHITFNSNGDYLTAEVFRTLLQAGLSHAYVTNHSDHSEPPRHIQEILNDPGLAAHFSYFQQLRKLENRGGDVDLSDFVDEGRVAGKDDIDRCISTIHTMTINVDGSTSFCCNDFARKPEEQLGTIDPDNPETTVKTIWKDPKYRDYRKAIKYQDRDNLHPLCTRCNLPGDSGTD